MRYAMYLITASGEELRIPVLPEKLAVESPGKNETAGVLGMGEVLLLRKKGLRTVAWDSFFPAMSAPWAAGRLTPPMELVRAIQSARDSREPLRLLLLGADLDVNTQMGVESFSYEERGGEPGDLYYSIKLCEWRDHGAKTLTLAAQTGTAAAAAPARGGAPASPKSHTVVSGESLWAIAKRAYGDGAKWRAVYDANKGAIGANPDLIYPGQVLTLP